MKSRKAVVEAIRRKPNFIVQPPLRDQLLARALQEQEESCTTHPALSEPATRRMIMRISTTRIAIATLIGAGVVTAAAVGVSIQKYRFVEKRPEQGYIVRSEDGHSGMNITEDHAASPEQAVATAEEIALLKQQGQKELVGVTEIEVNGQLDLRVLSNKYHLSDGRTITMGEGDPDFHPPMTLAGERFAEARRLLQEIRQRTQLVRTDEGTYEVTGDGERIPTCERVIQGRTFRFKKYEFTLSDGTPVAWLIGTLKDNP
jgi:hypothetical protein